MEQNRYIYLLSKYYACVVFFLSVSASHPWTERGAVHVTKAVCHKTKHDCDEFLKTSTSTQIIVIHCWKPHQKLTNIVVEHQTGTEHTEQG